MNVPSAVAIAVEISAISTELVNAFARSGSANGCAQWRSVKPCQVKLKRPWLSLNENAMMMKIGMKRYSSASTDHAVASDDDPETLLAIDAACARLAETSPRLARLVELRFFGALSEAEVAQELGVTVRTVQREWAKARALLALALES